MISEGGARERDGKLCKVVGSGVPQRTSYSSSRWCPTPEQLGALEELYKRGIRTPSTFQIQQITTQLRRLGRIEGKNVFYWFQNHKARERQKLRRRLLLYAAAAKPSPSLSSFKGLAGSPDVELALHNNHNHAHHHTVGSPTVLSHTTTPTTFQEAVLVKAGAESREGERELGHGWIQQQQQQLLLQQSDNGISPCRHSHVDIQLQTPTFRRHEEELSINNVRPETLALFPLHGSNCDHKLHRDPLHFYQFL